jgi:hypothetical protein
MKNEQVIELYYNLKCIEGIEFESPPPIEGETTLFNYSLDNGKLIIKLKQHCSSIEEGKKLVTNFLSSWELDDALNNGRRRFEFIYHNSKIIDSDNPNALIHYGQVCLKLGVSGELKVIYPSYPNHPKLFKASPDALTLWQRYEGYLENTEPLQSMAYFCLTLLEFRAGDRDKESKKKNREKAAEMYHIDLEFLNKIGRLTSQCKGTEETARKLKSGISPQPLTAREIEWIKAALKAIIRSVGEINAAPSLPTITMNELPQL